MTSTLNILSPNQGQIFGARPSMEDFERQLTSDPNFMAFEKLCAGFAFIATLPGLWSTHILTKRFAPAFQ